MKELLLILVPSLVTACITWIVSRKKNDAEANEIGIKSVSGAVKIWQDLASEFKKEVDELKVLVHQYRAENEHLRHEIKQIEQKFNLK